MRYWHDDGLRTGFVGKPTHGWFFDEGRSTLAIDDKSWLSTPSLNGHAVETGKAETINPHAEREISSSPTSSLSITEGPTKTLRILHLFSFVKDRGESEIRASSTRPPLYVCRPNIRNPNLALKPNPVCRKRSSNNWPRYQTCLSEDCALISRAGSCRVSTYYT